MPACQACSVDLPDGARFCFSCGATQIAPTCVSCDSPLVAGARFCMECGAVQDSATTPAAPLVQTGAPVSARRVTSVLFGDLVGFTTLSESRDQEEVRELLSRYFDECRRVIERYGGTVEKFIGDAVMAVWGVPTAHEDDAERAVRAGLELVNLVASMGEELGVPDLSMRVGIVTGEVAVTIGAEHQGMVAGDAVNTAARVQTVADPGQVWVDETTRLLTSAAITYVDVGSHALKGKADPVPLWSVRAVVAAVGGAQRADGLEAPLIGRERELRVVKELFHAVEESRRPAMLVMVGEPGIGKTRLAWEFEKYIDGLSGTTRWHQGRCVAYGEGVAFFALAEAVRGRLRAPFPGVDDADDTAVDDAATLLDVGLERYVADPSEREWLRPRLGVLLGIGSAGTYPREDLFASWVAFFERVGGGEFPVALVIDDAHHADDGLLSFFEHLLDLATFPCFVLLLTRPGLLDQHPSLATNRRTSLSHLATLADQEMGALLDGLVAGLPAAVRDSLVARSAGVPLYAVETVRSLIDRDLVVPRGGQYVLADPENLNLDSIAAPTTLQALVAARLDALTPRQRRVLDFASVIGEVFTRDQAEALDTGSVAAGDLDEVLASLVRLQILGQQANRLSADYGRYHFMQSVVRQVAYGTLSRRDRKAAHLAVAALSEAQADPAGDLAPIIAQHYLDAVVAMPSDADAPELEAHAVVHLERAAARARDLGAFTEAAGHLTVALERVEEASVRAKLGAEIAHALQLGGDYVRAAAHAEAAMSAFDELGDVASAADAAGTLTLSVFLTGDVTGARELIEPRWRAVADAGVDDEVLLRVAQAYAVTLPPSSDEKRVVYDRRIQLASKLGDTSELATALQFLGTYYLSLGAPDMSRLLQTASTDLARTAHDHRALAGGLTGLVVELNSSDLPRAIEMSREAVEAAGRAGVRYIMGLAEANLVIALVAAGEWPTATALMADSDATELLNTVIYAGLGGYLGMVRGEPAPTPWPSGDRPASEDPNDRGWTGLAEAAAARGRGDLDTALREAAVATDAMFESSDLSDDFVHVWPTAVELAVECGDAVTRDRLLALVDDGAQRGAVPRAVSAHRTRFAGLLARFDDPEQVEPLLRSAIDLFDAWGSGPYRARTEVELGQWLLDRGSADEGRVLVEQGTAVLTELGAHAWLTELAPTAHRSV